jgi:hypothetical protein
LRKRLGPGGRRTLRVAISVKDLNGTLQGGRFWSDHPLAIYAEYVAQNAIEPGLIIIIAALQAHDPGLIEWNSRFYIVYGAIFNETLHYSGRLG